jgi:uncharacterized membrane protein YdjX (TVP38/TMEM64 family)
VLVVLALAGLLVWAAPELWRIFQDPQVVRDWIRSWGPWAPAVFVFLQVLQVVVFVLPGEVTQIAGGWVFGFGLGSLLSVVGIALGSAIAFGLTRWLGVGFVHRIAGPETVAKFDHLMASPKFIGSLFLFFLIPGIPKDVLCYVAGLSRLKFLPFLLISSVARLPGIFGSSLMGKALYQGNWLLLAGIAGGALVLFGLGFWFREPIFRLVERYAVSHDAAKDDAP